MVTPPPPGWAVRGNDWRPALHHAHRSAPPAVTVVVVHYEQPAQLARTLHALGRQTHPRELLEVVVVDDGSAQPPAVPAGVRLLRRADVGFTAAAARNQGARAASHPVLVFLDADTTPEPAFVSELAALPGLVPDAVVVGRRRHAELEDTAPDAAVEVIGPARELPEPAWLTRGYAETGDLLRADEGSYRYVISSVLACSRWLFDELGGFDESLDRYGGEDWEWAWRAWTFGAVLAHRPTAVAWHDGPDWAARADRTSTSARAEKDDETLRLAQRIAAPTASLGGLLVGPAEVVVTFGDRLTPTQLLIAADSALTALPHSIVVAPPTAPDALREDPRVVDVGRRAFAAATWPRQALRVHVEAAVAGPVEAWRALLAKVRGSDAPHTLRLHDDRGDLITLDVLRAHRRGARWGRDDLFEARALHLSDTDPPLRRVPADAALEAWTGGWL